MPKCALYYIENHKIEVFNSLLGKEKVFLNGKKVSERTADVGTVHTFTIGKNMYRIAQRDATYKYKGNMFEIRRNGMPISLVNLLPNSSVQLLLLVIIMGLGLGFIIGSLLYKTIWPVVSV